MRDIIRTGSALITSDTKELSVDSRGETVSLVSDRLSARRQ